MQRRQIIQHTTLQECYAFSKGIFLHMEITITHFKLLELLQFYQALLKNNPYTNIFPKEKFFLIFELQHFVYAWYVNFSTFHYFIF